MDRAGGLGVNLVTGRPVVVAAGRAGRPHGGEAPGRCPFCPGNESLLAPILYERPSAAGGWAIRVVRNLYPIFTPGSADAPGHNEVVIESPRHDADLPSLAADEALAVVLAWRDRYRALAARWPEVLVFRNGGRRAGASLAHPHSQIAAFGAPAPAVEAREARARAHHRRTGRCLVEDMAAAALADGERLVHRDGAFVAFVPEAAEAPFETWIVPVAGARDFGGLGEDHAAGFARILADMLRRLATAASGPSYNLMILTAPRGSRRAPHTRWFACIRPRLVTPGALEYATGLSVNISLARNDAAALRTAGER